MWAHNVVVGGCHGDGKMAALMYPPGTVAPLAGVLAKTCKGSCSENNTNLLLSLNGTQC